MMDPALAQAQVDAVDRLTRAVSWSDGFSLAVVVVDSRRLLDVLLGQLDRVLVWVAPSVAMELGLGHDDELARDIGAQLEQALGAHSADCTVDGPVLVLDLSSEEPWHLGAWKQACARLNLQRNELIQAWPRPVIVAVHPAVEPVFATWAPDLWSLRGPGLNLRDLLQSGTEPLPLNHGPGDLVRAATRVLPFVGRQDQLTRMQRWCRQDTGAMLTLVHGPGGSGKTRLAVELCIRQQTAGWMAGMLSPKADHAAIGRLVGFGGDRLVVVDYAETRRSQVETLLDLAAQLQPDSGRLRILLIAREAGEWWRRLAGGHPGRALVQRAGLLPLGSLTLSKKARAELFQAALKVFAAWSGRPLPTAPPPRRGSPSLPCS